MLGNVLKNAEIIMERDHDFARHAEYRTVLKETLRKLEEIKRMKEEAGA